MFTYVPYPRETMIAQIKNITITCQIYASLQCFPLPSPQSLTSTSILRQVLICFQLLCIISHYLEIFSIQSYGINSILLASLTQYNYFDFFQCFYMYQYSIPYYWAVFHCVDIPLYRSPIDGHLNYFQFLAIKKIRLP